MRYLLAFLILFSFPALAENPSGLPVPRFVSLKSDETNLRTGPGTRYPIQWVLRRAHMPVEVVDEFELWRKIRAEDGTTGWVHHSMLAGKRFAMIAGKEPRILRIDSDLQSKPLFKAEPEVIGGLIECKPLWCRMQVAGRKAWIQKEYIWGITPQEVFD